MTANKENIGRMFLQKAAILGITNLMALIVLLMAYKPMSLDGFDGESAYIYFGLGKNLMLLALAVLMLLFVAKHCLTPCTRIAPKLYASISPIVFFPLFIATSKSWNVSEIYARASFGVALFNLAQFLTIYLLLYFASRKVRMKRFAVFMAYLAFILSITVIPEALSVPLGTRLIGLAGNSTALGAFSAFGFISVVYLKSLKGRSSILLSSLQVVFLLCSILSGSRNVLMSLFFALLAYASFSRREIGGIRGNAVTYLKWLVVAITVTVAGVSVASTGFFQLFSRDDALEHSRAFIWGIVYVTYLDGSTFTKLFGNGYGFLKDTFRSAHNTYLQILIEYGAVFLILFVSYLFFLFRRIAGLRCSACKNYDHGYLAALVVFVIIFSFSLNVLFVGVFSICYLILCFVIAVLILNRHDLSNVSASRL